MKTAINQHRDGVGEVKKCVLLAPPSGKLREIRDETD